MTRPEPPEPARLEAFRRKAASLIRSPERLRKLAGGATAKLNGLSGDRLAGLKDELALAIALLRAWVSGEYQDVSRQTIVSVAAAVLYFLVPLDAIPDFLLGLGYVDDVAVLGYVFSQVRAEIRAFERWRNGAVPNDEEQNEENMDG